MYIVSYLDMLVLLFLWFAGTMIILFPDKSVSMSAVRTLIRAALCRSRPLSRGAGCVEVDEDSVFICFFLLGLYSSIVCSRCI